ncbi:hypothetical protein FGO68_gene7485 [Halteria grandinella]|uniref:Protein kinase domain-containing protein n=1 Tax=Halteria grandinella TaxID=5974 RepID=A0A8J8NGD4_HALGN|nr:hypothetical protein FGO68_gene7485 [Halteria grandinella]
MTFLQSSMEIIVSITGRQIILYLLEEIILDIFNLHMDKYSLIKNLGSGTFATAIMAKNKETSEIVTVKMLTKKYDTWDECLQLREIKLLQKYGHTNIRRLKEVIRANNKLYMIFEYMDGTIYDMILKQRANGMSEELVKSIIAQVLQGLEFLHGHGVFHRDLKPENILFSYDEKQSSQRVPIVKLADFGLAKEVGSQKLGQHTDYVSTRWYRAPELLLQFTNYDQKIDIFALGCIAVELILGYPLAAGFNEADQVQKLCKVIGNPEDSWIEGSAKASMLNMQFQSDILPIGIQSLLPKTSQPLIDLIQRMLRWDPKNRISAKECLLHPAIKDAIRPAAKQLQPPLIENGAVGNRTLRRDDSAQKNVLAQAARLSMGASGTSTIDYSSGNVTPLKLQAHYQPQLMRQTQQQSEHTPQHIYRNSLRENGMSQPQFNRKHSQIVDRSQYPSQSYEFQSYADSSIQPQNRHAKQKSVFMDSYNHMLSFTTPKKPQQQPDYRGDYQQYQGGPPPSFQYNDQGMFSQISAQAQQQLPMLQNQASQSYAPSGTKNSYYGNGQQYYGKYGSQPYSF